MKYLLILVTGLVMMSCGVTVPYTNEVRDEFGLDSENMIKKVQFYTSATITLEKSKESGGQGTDDGVLVSSSSKEQEMVIIPVKTKCVFDSYGENGSINVRFETGVGKILTFNTREGQTSGKYYLVADWSAKEGGEIEYGNMTYHATKASGVAHLMVKKKKLQKTKRKARYVKGMKI